MVKTSDILRNIKSETKIQIGCWLLKYPKGLTVTELTEYIGCKRTNVSKQINEMKKSGLLDLRKEGKNNFYSFSTELHDRQTKMIKEIVNSYHLVDEQKENYEIYK